MCVCVLSPTGDDWRLHWASMWPVSKKDSKERGRDGEEQNLNPGHNKWQEEDEKKKENNPFPPLRKTKK